MNINNIKKIIKKGSVAENVPMSRRTTLRVGGNARYFITPADTKELSGLVRYLYNNRIEYYVVGNGSNILVSDLGYDGAIIDLGSHDGTEFTMLGLDDSADPVIFDAGAGSLMPNLGKLALRFSASGFEPLSGIPGCIGGAVAMNAGAYGGEMADIVRNATVVDKKGEIKKLSKEELKFGYRHSAVMDEGYIVARVEYELKKGEPEKIKALMEEYTAKRKEKQPLEYPSAGSTFKRPEGSFAGKLIEEAGLCGFEIGGAAVSRKHCGFVINKGNATASDIYRLINEIKNRVYENSGVMLEPEVRMLGKFEQPD